MRSSTRSSRSRASGPWCSIGTRRHRTWTRGCSDEERATSMRSGRFAGGLLDAMRELNASIDFDRRLYAEDIDGSLAWAEALRARGVLDAAEEKKVREGLEAIRGEIESGTFPFSR